jgi:hypothetical protein
MEKYIINSFLYKKFNTINDIFHYIKLKYNTNVGINNIKNIIHFYIKCNIVLLNENNNYYLTEEGNKILHQQITYSYRIIIQFFKKYTYNKLDNPKYYLKEVREEQQKLRNYLINNKEQICIICDKKLPLCLLETAHLKPRYLLNCIEKNDNNVVEFMCRFCHKLYDDGYLGVYNGLLCVSQVITKNKYDLQYNENKQIIYYNIKNNRYFDYHYRKIYK